MSLSDEEHYRHLGSYSGLVQLARAIGPLFPPSGSGEITRQKAREVLRFPNAGSSQATDIRIERQWNVEEITGEEVSWSVGFGPRTRAWVLKPQGSAGLLPAILALHDHGHFKFYGKEKIADGPEGHVAEVKSFRSVYYGGRAFVNELARRGFVVLVHDVFLWGSRKFPLEIFPEEYSALANDVATGLALDGAGAEVGRYNGAAYLHEHLVSKYCTLLGTSLAAIVAYEDRCALGYLRSRGDVDARRTGCIGLSGGGARAALLRATADHLQVCAIAGMMSTYQDLLDHCVAPHTWMFFPTGWSRHGDWPDLAASAAPSPLLVQYLLDDPLFTPNGMRNAHRKIEERYVKLEAASAYSGEFYPGPHRFDIEMQERAFAWLLDNLGAAVG